MRFQNTAIADISSYSTCDCDPIIGPCQIFSYMHNVCVRYVVGKMRLYIQLPSLCSWNVCKSVQLTDLALTFLRLYPNRHMCTDNFTACEKYYFAFTCYKWKFFFFFFFFFVCLFFSSPEPSGSQGELIVYPCSVVRRRRCRCQQCLNIFSSETA